MNLTRRAFFIGLAALPFVGRLFKPFPVKTIVLSGEGSFMDQISKGIERGDFKPYRAAPGQFTWYEDEWLPPKTS